MGAHYGLKNYLSSTDAVQFPNVGIGQQYECESEKAKTQSGSATEADALNQFASATCITIVLGWLKNVTFAEENKYGNDAYSRQMFEKVVKRLINVGTTTCSYFSSIHVSAAKVLANVCHEAGQRALIGKCNVSGEGVPQMGFVVTYSLS